jgi:pimeloyl-ACP methyl ester carboxylesterase
MSLAQKLAIGYYRTKFKILAAVSKRRTAELAFELFSTPQLRYKKFFPKIFDKAEKLELKIQGETAKGYRWNKGAGRRVLIAHGFNSTVAKFDRYITPLIKKGYEVLAFDAPAHGRSSGKQINAVLYKDMILEIIRQYGPIESFMAHSFGGLAITLALEETRHSEDYRVVLIAPATESRTAIDFFVSFMKLDDDVRKEFENYIYKMRGKPADWYSVSRAVEHVQATILWVHDEDDDLTPWQDARKVQEKNHPHIRFVVTRGLGHRRIYRDNKVSKEIIAFL